MIAIPNPQRLYTRGLELIPHHMRDGVIRYLENGIEGGSFQTAVFANDLVQAFARADHINTMHMREWADFLYNHAPISSRGSYEKVKLWCEAGGLIGMERLASLAEDSE